MGKKENKAYAMANKNFIMQLLKKDDVTQITRGVFYKVLTKGSSDIKPIASSVVSVHYEGRLIDGTIFDSSADKDYAVAFRLRELIEGWKIALLSMHIGDKWEIYLSHDMGYGAKKVDNIPAHSTLIFTVELCAVN